MPLRSAMAATANASATAHARLAPSESAPRVSPTTPGSTRKTHRRSPTPMSPRPRLSVATALVLLLAVSLMLMLTLTPLVNATPTSASTAATKRPKPSPNDPISSAAQIVTSPLGPPPDAEVLVGPGNRSILARAAAFGPRLPVPPRLLPPADSDPDTPPSDDDDNNGDGSDLPPDTDPRPPADPPAVQIVAGRLVPLALADPGNHHGCVPVPPSMVAHWPTGPTSPPVAPLPPASRNRQSRNGGYRGGNSRTRDQSPAPPLIMLPPRPPFAFTSSLDADDDNGNNDAFDSSSPSSLSLDSFFSPSEDWPPLDPPTLIPPSAPAGGPWIALVQRGGCAFVDKVRAMQRSGATAVVVGDDDPSTGAMLVTMYAGGDVSDVRISAVFVSFADYQALVAQADAGDDVDVWLVGNGTQTEEWTVVDMILAAVVAPLILLVGVYALCRACIRSAGAPNGADGRNGGPPEPATSARILASLPTKVFYLAKAREEDCLTCVICLDEFEDDVELVELPCKHTFHGECIQTWLRDRKNVCPICRFELVERDEEEGGGAAANDEEVDVGNTPGAVDIPGPGFAAAAANHGVPPHVISLSLPNAPPRAASAPPASSTVINMPPSPVGRGRRRVRVPSRLAATAAAEAAAAAAAAAAAVAAVGVARSRSADQDEALPLVEGGLETSLGDGSEEYLVQRVASAERTDEDDEDETLLSSSPLTEVEEARPRFVRISVPEVDAQGDESDAEDEDAPLLGR